MVALAEHRVRNHSRGRPPQPGRLATLASPCTHDHPHRRRLRPRHDADRHRPGFAATPARARREELGVEFHVDGDDRAARPAAGPAARATTSPRTRSPRRGDRVPGALPRPRDRSDAWRSPAPTRRSPPYAGTAAGRAGHRQVRAQRPAARRPPRLRRRPPRGLGVGARQGRGAAPRRRLGLRRRPRPRRRGRAGRRRAQRLGADRRLHPRGAARGRAPTWCCDDLTEFPAWLDEHLLDQRLAALEEDLQRARIGAGRVQRRSRLRVPAAAAVRALGPDRRGRRDGVLRTPCRRPSATRPRDSPSPSASGCSRRRPTRWSGRATAPTPATAATSARPSCSTYSPRWPQAHGLAHVATGTNADDAVAGFRPGIRAADERGAITPLRDAGLTKEQVRAASRRWGLPTWDKPAAACLSSPGRLRHRGHARTGWPGSSGPRPPYARVLAAAGVDVRNLRVRDLGDRRLASRSTPDLLDGCPGRSGGRVLDAVRAAGFDDADARPARVPVGIDERAAGPAVP